MIFTIITVIFAIILVVLAAISVEQKDIVRSIIFLMAFLFVLSANFIFLDPHFRYHYSVETYGE